MAPPGDACRCVHADVGDTLDSALGRSFVILSEVEVPQRILDGRVLVAPAPAEAW